MTQKFIKTSDAAKEIGMSSRTIRRAIVAGEFPNAQKFKCSYLIPVNEWEQFKARNFKRVG